MRTTPPYDAKQPVVHMPCTKCGARPGDRCTRPSGALAPWQHSNRYRALRALENEVHL